MLYRTMNRNKKSIVLDLKSEPGQEAVRQLVAHCDVLLENFRPGTLEKWGLGPHELDLINPHLVVVRISAFGQTGPRAEQPGFAAVAEAVGGLRELVGEPDRPPSRVGVSIGDSIAGLYGAFGAVMALFQRDRVAATDPRGGAEAPRLPLAARTIDVALNESVLSVMESLIPDHTAYGIERVRTGGRVEGIAPSNSYTCADGGSVVIAGNSDSIFVRLMHAIGRTDLAEDSGLGSNAGRWTRREELDAAISAWTTTLPRDLAVASLEAANVPCGPIYTAADIVADEQYNARNMIQYLAVDAGDDDGAARPVGFSGIVPVIGDQSLPIRTLGPDLGEHTVAVLTGLLGLTEQQATRGSWPRRPRNEREHALRGVACLEMLLCRL